MIKQLLKDGYYAFMDYAAVYWAQHLKAAVGAFDLSKSLAEICNLLESFLELHWKGPEPAGEIPPFQREALKPFEDVNEFRRISSAYGTAISQLRFFGEKSKQNSTTTVIDTVIRIRCLLESIMLETASDATIQSKLKIYYGENLYKCARPSCTHFYRGFSSLKERERHANDHELPFRCAIEGCLREDIGFTNRKDLQKHMVKQHDQIHEKARKYPNMEAPDAPKLPDCYICDICSKTFSKYYNHKDHLKLHKMDLMGTHGNDKSFDCDVKTAMKQLWPPLESQITDTASTKIFDNTGELVALQAEHVDKTITPAITPTLLPPPNLGDVLDTPDTPIVPAMLENYGSDGIFVSTIHEMSQYWGLFSGGEEIRCSGFCLDFGIEIRFGDAACEILQVINSNVVLLIAPPIPPQTLPYRVAIKIVDKFTGCSLGVGRSLWFHYVVGDGLPQPDYEPFLQPWSPTQVVNNVTIELIMLVLFQIYGTDFRAIQHELFGRVDIDRVRKANLYSENILIRNLDSELL
jgi:hypothetical protein